MKHWFNMYSLPIALTLNSPMQKQALVIKFPSFFPNPSFSPFYSSLYSSIRLDEANQVDGRNQRCDNSSPSCSNDGLVGHRPSSIPSQMSQRVKPMEHKRPRDRRLRRNLQRNRPSRKRSSHRGAREGKSDKWADKVGEAEDVETAGHKRASNTVKSRGVPGYLRAVDGEVGRGWAVAALLDEDFVGVFWGDVLGCDGPVEAVLVYAV